MVESVAKIGLVGLGLLLVACGPEPPPPRPSPPAPAMPMPSSAPPPQPTAPSQAFPTVPGERRFQRVLSKRFQLSIRLPDRDGWTLSRDSKRFSLLVHRASQSSLLFGIWRETGHTTAEGCEAKARLWRELPERGSRIAEGQLEAPKGYSTHFDVGIGVTAPGEPIRGYLLAFGVAPRTCLAFVYETRAEGPGAEMRVSDRLAVIQSASLFGLKRRSGLPP